ncbi:hypothetical protein D1872_38730 [compost metagenome]
MADIKEFLNVWSPKNVKEMEKDERTRTLFDYIPLIVEFYTRQGHKRQDEVKQLFDRMEDKKFLKNLMRILKTLEENPVDLALTTVISDFLTSRGNKLDEEFIDGYTNAVTKLLKERTKYVVEKTGISKDLAQELLVIVPEPEVTVEGRFVPLYVSKVLNKLYGLSRDERVNLGDSKTIKKIVKALFGKDEIENVALIILMEYRDKHSRFTDEQKVVWGQLTTFALDTIEKKDKADVKDILESYVDRRIRDEKKGRDRPRRIQFEAVNEEDYPKIRKAVSKLKEKDRNAKYLA